MRTGKGRQLFMLAKGFIWLADFSMRLMLFHTFAIFFMCPKDEGVSKKKSYYYFFKSKPTRTPS